VFVAFTYISFPGVENFYTLHKLRTFEARTGMNPIFILHISSIYVVNVSDMTVCKKVKKQAIPLQAWTGSEGSRRMRLPDFKTVGT